MPRIDLLLSNGSPHRRLGTARLSSDGIYKKCCGMLESLGTCRPRAGRAIMKLNDVENRSNPAKLAPASGPSLVSLSPAHLLASRPSCLRKLVCAGTIMEFPGGKYSPSS